jgi:hypothetical protein
LLNFKISLQHASLYSLALVLINFAGILVGFGFYVFLKPVNQILVQVPIAAGLSILGFISWYFISPKVFKKKVAIKLFQEWLFTLLLTLIWTPLIFVPIYYIFRGRLTGFGNIWATWLFQIPVNGISLAMVYMLACKQIDRNNLRKN